MLHINALTKRTGVFRITGTFVRFFNFKNMRLKDIRINANMNQSQVAEIIKTNIPLISNYENDISFPALEDVVILQNYFNQKIDLKDDLTQNQKHHVVQGVINLCQAFPVPVVAEFLARVYRRETSPESLIIHFANIVSNDIEEPLIFPV